MKPKRYYLVIRPQRYRDCWGNKPLSFGVWLIRPWRRKQFLCYAWSLSRAWVALQLIKQTAERWEAQWQKKNTK